MTGKYPKWLSWVTLAVGIMFLIKDIMGSPIPASNVARYWWSINWWTAAFIIAGLAGLFRKK